MAEIIAKELVKYEFTVEDNNYPYQGMLEFTFEEWEIMTYEEINTRIMQQYNKWKNYILGGDIKNG